MSACDGVLVVVGDERHALLELHHWMASADELDVATERQRFLNAQAADLIEAMTTLEDAIKKIDKESGDMLRSTFDAVNKNFGELFPELFGGGDAKLIMTGDEVCCSNLVGGLNRLRTKAQVGNGNPA